MLLSKRSELNFISFVLSLLMLGSTASCRAGGNDEGDVPGRISEEVEVADAFQTGAMQTGRYFPLLHGKRVGVTGNQSSVVGGVHLVDTLRGAGINVVKVYSPEHGFRGEAEAGASVAGGVDAQSGIPLISLYGKNKKPTPKDLSGIDIMLFDIQDVGARFYTYISTLHYVMEACAEAGIPVLVLDRPNPNDHYVDGPVLETGYTSFIGMHPVALVHGMTMAEYARMINGEGWLANGVKCDLAWIDMPGYTRQMLYTLPIDPSPNLQDMDAIYLYPSVCLLEGTVASVGRGTDYPFRLIGHPAVKTGDTTFVPRVTPGKSESPKFLGEVCHGWLLTGSTPDGKPLTDTLDLTWLLRVYQEVGGDSSFFKSSFNLLAGNNQLRKQVVDGTPDADIRASWEPALTQYKSMRLQYLLYPAK
jgi:uncharacterized protein YbbC (DUF1343 family)